MYSVCFNWHNLSGKEFAYIHKKDLKTFLPFDSHSTFQWLSQRNNNLLVNIDLFVYEAGI